MSENKTHNILILDTCGIPRSSVDGSDGKAKDSELNGPWFNPLPRKEFFFWLVDLEPFRSASKYLPHCHKTHDNK